MSRRATRPSVAAVVDAPERTCFRCDGVFRVVSDDRRVYCPDCRRTYGFPVPMLTDFTPGARLALFAAELADLPEVRSA